MRKNTRFLATPGAAKVDQGPLGANAHAGVAKKVGKHEVFGHPKGGLARLEAPKVSQKCIICRVFAAIFPNSGIPRARLEALEKENKRCVYMCVCV